MSEPKVPPPDDSGDIARQPARKAAFVAILFVAMASATLPIAALGVLATFLIDDLGIARSTLGWIVATNVIVAAGLSVSAGGITDSLGGRRAVAIVFGASGVAFLMLGTAPAVWVLFAASLVAALSQASGNPATNLLIKTHLSGGNRGTVTGVKQSGVQAGATLAGLALPTMAIGLGWRPTLVLVSLIPLSALVLVLAMVPATVRTHTVSDDRRGTTPSSVRWLATYGLTFGFAGSTTFYVPLYVEEAVGLDPRIAGVAAAAIGATAFAARILWARIAERSDQYLRPLWIMAIGSAVATILMGSGTTVPFLIWPAAIGVGATSSAWNSVGMLAVINKAGSATGKASGIVLLGFLVGLGIGPPLYGATVDATGSYATMWFLGIAASVVSAIVISVWRRSSDDVWALDGA